MKRYFIPRNSRFYSMIAHMTSRMRYLFCLSFFLIVGFGWYFFIYRSVEHIIQQQEKKIDSAQESMHAFCLATEKKENVSAAYAQMQQQIMMPTNDKHECLFHFMKIVESVPAAQMQLISYTMQQPHIADNYAIYYLHVSIKGSPEQFISWMGMLEAMHLPALYTRCTFVAEQNGFFTGAVEIKCTLFTPKSSTKRPSNLEQAEGLGG